MAFLFSTSSMNDDDQGEVLPRSTIDQLKEELRKHRITNDELEILSEQRSFEIMRENPFLIDHPVIIS